MPIDIATGIEVFDQEKFHALDRQVMRIVFDVHNEFGGLMDEKLYKCEIAARCSAMGAVEIYSGSQALGTQDLNLVNEQVALAVTAKHDGVGAMRENLLRLLQHTRLRYIQWINLNHHVAEFTTLSR